MDIKDFAGTTPVLLPEQFLTGTLRGWGVVESILGGLQKRFVVRARGDWEEATQILSFIETWTFDNGRSDTLYWKIIKRGIGHYSGSERRIDGEAKGEQMGCAFHWTYSRDTPQDDGKSALLNYDDWFYRIDERVLMVSGSAGRVGIPFAMIHGAYQRV